MRTIRLIAVMLIALLGGCQVDGTGLVLAPGWSYHSLGAWKHLMPNHMAMGAKGRWLYFGSELSEHSAVAGVAALNVENGHTHVLVEGLRNVNGVGFAPDGSLWVAEGGEQGLIWRMSEPAHFPDNQRVNSVSRESTHLGFAPFRFAGSFDHKAIAFSSDHRFAYLADAASGGSLYRLDIRARQLAVFHRRKGWLKVVPEDAVIAAHKLGAVRFESISDMERLPNGTLLLAESASGRILVLDDQAEKPVVKSWLERSELRHPGDMVWDASRQWLWITDAATPSTLWAWDGHNLHQIIRHPSSRISGVQVADGKIYVNIQLGRNNPSMTFILQERNPG